MIVRGYGHGYWNIKKGGVASRAFRAKSGAMSQLRWGAFLMDAPQPRHA